MTIDIDRKLNYLLTINCQSVNLLNQVPSTLSSSYAKTSRSFGSKQNLPEIKEKQEEETEESLQTKWMNNDTDEENGKRKRNESHPTWNHIQMIGECLHRMTTVASTVLKWSENDSLLLPFPLHSTTHFSEEDWVSYAHHKLTDNTWWAKCHTHSKLKSSTKRLTLSWRLLAMSYAMLTVYSLYTYRTKFNIHTRYKGHNHQPIWILQIFTSQHINKSLLYGKCCEVDSIKI